MKGAIFKRILVGGALLFGIGAPVIPEEMELLYSIQCPCLPEVTVSATSTVEVPGVISASDDTYSVFRDRSGNKVYVPITKEQYARMGQQDGYSHNTKRNDHLSVFEAAANLADAAVARDSELFAYTDTGSSFTFAFTNTAGNVAYFFGHDRATGATQIANVSYAAASSTKILELDGAAGQNDRAITAWRLNSPATGANNVVVNTTTSLTLRFNAVSYSGASTVTSENGTDTSIGSGVTSISTDITPTFTGCWMGMFTKDGSGGTTYTNTTGDSIRLNADAGGHAYTDTNGTITGANTITNTMAARTLGALAWTICPPQGGAVTYPTDVIIFD
jgi:hypothetical protein